MDLWKDGAQRRMAYAFGARCGFTPEQVDGQRADVIRAIEEAKTGIMEAGRVGIVTRKVTGFHVVEHEGKAVAAAQTSAEAEEIAEACRAVKKAVQRVERAVTDERVRQLDESFEQERKGWRKEIAALQGEVESVKRELADRLASFRDPNWAKPGEPDYDDRIRTDGEG